jgi:hypothetical protein
MFGLGKLKAGNPFSRFIIRLQRVCDCMWSSDYTGHPGLIWQATRWGLGEGATRTRRRSDVQAWQELGDRKLIATLAGNPCRDPRFKLSQQRRVVAGRSPIFNSSTKLNSSDGSRAVRPMKMKCCGPVSCLCMFQIFCTDFRVMWLNMADVMPRFNLPMRGSALFAPYTSVSESSW